MPKEPPIHVEVWVAAKLLTQEKKYFTPRELKDVVWREFQDKRPGVQVHIYLHCVANLPANPNRLRYLTKTDQGIYKLFEEGDPYDPSREGSKTQPDKDKVPEKYHHLYGTDKGPQTPREPTRPPQGINENTYTQGAPSPEGFLNQVNAFERELRNHVKERLGINHDSVLASTVTELVENWNRRRRRDSENGKPTESEMINYAEMGDYVTILLKNRESFNKEGYYVSDVITYLKKISYNRGKAAHPGDKPLDIQQMYATKDAIEWVQAWLRAK